MSLDPTRDRAAGAAGSGQGGFTLIELMVGMLLTGVIISFIFLVSGKMSTAYLGQSQVSEVQETLRTARAAIAADVRQAGFFMSDGFRTAAFGDPVTPVAPLQVVNDVDGSGPDAIRVYYGDATAATRVIAIEPAVRGYADVDSADAFEVGDVIVMVNSAIATPIGSTAGVITYDACVVKVTGIDAGTPDRLHFAVGSSGSPYNMLANPQCATVATSTFNEAPQPDTVAYRFVARSYRIDPDRRELSVLQGSPSGEMVDDDWMDLALGVTTIQVSSRYVEDGDAADLDDDGDPTLDWYSGEGQEATDPSGERPADARLVEMRISLEARTQRGTRAVATTRTAALTDEDNPDHNPIGDWDGVQLAGVPDGERPDGYAGTFIYRSADVLVDLRNLGDAK